ncbi:neuronal acetylcholine receptor subunit alpha-2-like [Amphiura filiformis]|uniref:neuronal acetylcholine receptor subunit alpha-2-like n=1 Tax=Amphiura filiformis TaxID=82378 RepID=UPI003B21AEB8
MEYSSLIILLCSLAPIVCSPHNFTDGMDSRENNAVNFQGRLVQDLLDKYGRGYVRPVLNTSTVTKVVYRLLIYELIDLDSRNQRITISAMLKQRWRDEFLAWNSSNYGNIASIQLPTDVIWIPDITLHRNIDGNFERIKSTKASVYSVGSVEWLAPAIFTSSCLIHVRYFPFDTQSCQFRFGSWAYHGLEIDLFPEVGADAVQNRFLKNGVWDLKNVSSEREIIHYACCPEPYPELVYTFVFQRRSAFYVAYLILPCMFLSGLSVLVFYLPPECGEKLTLSITNLLALVVFQQLIAESMPPNGDDPPLIGDYFLAMIIMVCLSVVFTALVINVSARSTKVPGWIRVVVLNILARITCTYRAEFDKDLSDITGCQNDLSNSSLRFAVTNEEPVPLKVNGMNGVASQESATTLERMQEDLKYIRRGFENKTWMTYKFPNGNMWRPWLIGACLSDLLFMRL